MFQVQMLICRVSFCLGLLQVSELAIVLNDFKGEVCQRWLYEDIVRANYHPSLLCTVYVGEGGRGAVPYNFWCIKKVRRLCTGLGSVVCVDVLVCCYGIYFIWCHVPGLQPSIRMTKEDQNLYTKVSSRCAFVCSSRQHISLITSVA